MKIPNKQVVIGTMQEKVDQQRQELMDSPLEIDNLYLVSENVSEKSEFPRMTANAFEKMQGTFNSLVYSFSDQNQLGEQKVEELNVRGTQCLDDVGKGLCRGVTTIS